MRLLLRFALLAAMAAATPVLAQSRACLAAGEKIHWMADYCMSKLETDDEIAASSCIEAELKRSFRSDCAAKVHYKSALCRLSISRKLRPDGIKGCLADKAFMGPTVRNGGVGGR
jgi:hypothetical protein